MQHRNKLTTTIMCAFTIAAGIGLILAQRALAGPDGVHISQVYSGGGTSTGYYRNDYIELFNAGATTADLSGWSLQYGSAAGNFGSPAPLPTGTRLEPGRYLLVQWGSAGSGGITLSLVISPDVIVGGSSMASTSGKVALSNMTTTLGCGSNSTPCVLPDPRIVDLVAYGNVTSTVEITAANYPKTLGTSEAIVRRHTGCQDTDNNFFDFAIVTGASVLPRNSDSSASVCGISIAKRAPALVQKGSPFTYALVVTNTGMSAANAVITDRLPANVSYVLGSASDGGQLTEGGVIQWLLGDALTHAAVLTRYFTVVSPLQSPLVVNADYAVRADNLVSPIAGQPVTTCVEPLAVAKSGPVMAETDSPIGFTLAFTNYSPLPMTGVSLTDALPPGMAYLADTWPGGSAQFGSQRVWQIGELAPGQSSTVVMTAAIDSPGIYTNHAIIAGNLSGVGAVSHATDWVVTAGRADPHVSMTGPHVVYAGSIATYTLVFGNAGILDAPSPVTLIDDLPEGVYASDITHDSSMLPATDGATSRSWDAGTLAAGSRMTFTLAFSIPAGLVPGASVTNTLRVQTSAASNLPGDDVAPAIASVAAQLRISLTAQPGIIAADGISVSQIVATIHDTAGSAIPFTDVTFTTTAGNVTPVATTGVDGVATATLTSAVLPGTADVTASVGDFFTSTQVRFDARHLNTLSITVQPDSLVADSMSTGNAVVFLADQFGAPVADAPVDLSAALVSLAMPGGQTGSAGLFTTMLTAGADAGQAAITATSGALSAIAYLILDPAPLELEGRYFASAARVRAGDSLTYTLTVTNASLGNVPDVVMTATVPLSTTLLNVVGGAATEFENEAPGSGQIVVWAGSLHPAQSHTLSFAVRVDDASGAVESSASYGARAEITTPPVVRVNITGRISLFLPLVMK